MSSALKALFIVAIIPEGKKENLMVLQNSIILIHKIVWSFFISQRKANVILTFHYN